MQNVCPLIKEQAHELATEWTGSSNVLCEKLVMFVIRDSGVDVYCPQSERVVIVVLILLGLVVQVNFEYVMIFLIILKIAKRFFL